MADNKTNLVDLTLLNTAYKINKKRIDNLSEKITTKSLNVGTATTNGTLIVNSGDFSADTLKVTGGMTINGGGVTLPSGKALTLKEGGNVEKLATFDSLTGSVKFGNAISNGNVIGSAQIVVPTGESLSLSGSAVTNSSTTIEGTITASNKPSVSGSLHATDTEVTSGTTITGAIIASNTNNKTLTVYGNLNAKETNVTSATTITGAIIASDTDSKTLTVYGTANLNGSTIGSATIKSGTVELNSNVLTVTSKSAPDGKITKSTIDSSTIRNGIVELNSNVLTVTSKSAPDGKITKSTIDSSTIQNGTIDLKDGSNSYTFTVKEASNGKINGSTISSSTIQNGTVDLKDGSNSYTFTVKEASNGKINGSTINSSTIQNGTVDLNSNNLTVTSASTITTITEGGTTTITGVGAIDAKSMTLQNTTTNKSSLVIDNIYDNVDEDDTIDITKVALYCKGGITGSRVYNAVWNDLADAIEVPFDTELEYGYCYKYKAGKVYKTDSYADANVMGIHSDTAGMVLGTKDKGTVCINLAVAGVVLAYVDKEYECGTALVATKEGKLTKANRRTRLFHPERIVATFYKTEIQDFWGSSTHKVAVNGRSWVKVR